MISLTREDADRIAVKARNYMLSCFFIGLVTGSGVTFCILKAI